MPRIRPIRIRPSCTVIAILILAATAGCTTTRTSSDERVAWPSEDGATVTALGTVALLVELDRVGPERLRDEKVREVDEVLRDALALLPNTRVVDRAEIAQIEADGTWPAASEHELIERARGRGIDTIGLVEVEAYLGHVHLYLFPPAWSSQATVRYRVRLLDVASGGVIGDVRRARRTGGFLSIIGRETLRRDFDDDLRDLVTAHR